MARGCSLLTVSSFRAHGDGVLFVKTRRIFLRMSNSNHSGAILPSRSSNAVLRGVAVAERYGRNWSRLVMIEPEALLGDEAGWIVTVR